MSECRLDVFKLTIIAMRGLNIRCRIHLRVHRENSISFHSEWDMIVVTVFFSILNQMEFYLVQNQWKTVITIRIHSILKEMEIYFSLVQKEEAVDFQILFMIIESACLEALGEIVLVRRSQTHGEGLAGNYF